MVIGNWVFVISPSRLIFLIVLISHYPLPNPQSPIPYFLPPVQSLPTFAKLEKGIIKEIFNVSTIVTGR
ncbi:hypothetical protein FDUTEX481_10023 [Tolypothrix sp. PCC 7601]|nr:hypothetical protein FDUTEX481_10023 [Tolypothrix sp. PCC 7601]